MNALCLAGFTVMAIGIALGHRNVNPARVLRNQIVLAMMIAGTVLVAFGIYVSPPFIP